MGSGVIKVIICSAKKRSCIIEKILIKNYRNLIFHTIKKPIKHDCKKIRFYLLIGKGFLMKTLLPTQNYTINSIFKNTFVTLPILNPNKPKRVDLRVSPINNSATAKVAVFVNPVIMYMFMKMTLFMV